MGLFADIASSIDKSTAAYEKHRQSDNKGISPSQLSFGGASTYQQEINKGLRKQEFGDIMGLMNLAQTNTTAQHSKDFRKLQTELVKTCAKQCLRKERNYASESEFCMTKCYDLAYIYTKIGLNELNNFAAENQLNQKP